MQVKKVTWKISIKFNFDSIMLLYCLFTNVCVCVRVRWIFIKNYCVWKQMYHDHKEKWTKLFQKRKEKWKIPKNNFEGMNLQK